MVDNAAGDSLVKLHYHVDINLLEEVTKKKRRWHTQDAEVPKISPSTSLVDKEQRK